MHELHPYIHFLIPMDNVSEWKSEVSQYFQVDWDEDTITQLTWFYSRPQFHNSSKDIAVIFLVILKNQLFQHRSSGSEMMHKKYAFIRELMKNPFMTQEQFDEIMVMFSQAQRLYFAMTRFVHHCKIKIAKVQVQTDLFLNTLDPASRHTFKLLHDGKVYYYALTDLVNLLITSITHSTNMFVMPLPCKNPYNNLPFRKHDLYNMYFHMQRVFVRVPALIELYFNHNFDVYRLKKYHENTLLHHVVDETIKNMSVDRMVLMFVEMETSVMSMDHVYVGLVERQSVVKYMRPHLYLYLLCKYVTDPFLRGNYHDELKWKLEQFHHANPDFFQIKRFLNRDTRVLRIELWVKSVPDMVEVPVTPPCRFSTTHVYDDAKYNSFIYRGYYNDSDHYPDECVSYQVLIDTLAEQSTIYTDNRSNVVEPPRQRPRYVNQTGEDDSEDDEGNGEDTFIENSSDSDDDDDDYDN